MSARRGFALPFIVITILLPIIILAAWAPWVTPNFAYKKIKATIKPPCEEFKPNLSSQFLGVAPPPYHKFIFGTEYFIPVDCHLSDVPNGNSYFVSFLGTTHKLSSTPNSSWGVRSTVSTTDKTVYPEASQSASLPVVQLVKKDLSDVLKIPESSIEVLSVDKAEWPDSCLGVDTGELCAQVITPGYKISLKGIDNKIYIYHTNLSKHFIIEKPVPGNL